MLKRKIESNGPQIIARCIFHELNH